MCFLLFVARVFRWLLGCSVLFLGDLDCCCGVTVVARMF